MSPLRRALFMSFSALDPLLRPVYQRELTVVSVPASEKAKPDDAYALFSTVSCWLIWLEVTLPLAPSVMTWK